VAETPEERAERLERLRKAFEEREARNNEAMAKKGEVNEYGNS
jgi:hypothetical protein